MRPIETRYNGYLFRSRLEARWAVFFETLGWQYTYEPEGFVLPDGTWYLPDFFLPAFGVWVEIKPQPPTEAQRQIAWQFAMQGLRYYLLYGPCASRDHGAYWVEEADDDTTLLPEDRFETIDAHVAMFSSCPQCPASVWLVDWYGRNGYGGACWSACRPQCTFDERGWESARFERAYTAARSARFEQRRPTTKPFSLFGN